MGWNAHFGPEFEPPQEILDMLASGELVDVSWYNDLTPSFQLAGVSDVGDPVILYSDALNPLHREFPDSNRFWLWRNGCGTLLETGCVSDALEGLKTLEKRC